METLGPVLLVDDDADLRRTVAYALAVEFLIAEAASGEEAWAAIARHKPRLIILDLVIPGTDTLALLRRLRAATPEIPVLMLTGNEDLDNAVATLALGAMLYITKPFEPEFLRDEVRRLLSGASRREAPWRIEEAPD